MAGRRQGWCPRCDEVRAARPGTACPACGRAGLLPLPAAQPDRPGASLGSRAGGRLRALLPAARTVGVAALVAAAVAGAFAAGRLTRTTPSAGAAPAATTLPALTDTGAVTGRRDLGWRAEDQGVAVTLRAVSVGVGFTRLELNVAGLDRRRDVTAVDGLRVQDAAGNDLLPGGEIAHVNTANSDPGPDGSVDAEVVLDRAIDRQALARVQVRGLTVAEDLDEHLNGVLVDPQLQRHLNEDGEFFRRRPDCPGCRVQVRCYDCRTIRVAGTAYRRGQVLLLLEPIGRVERSALNASRRRVIVFGTKAEMELTAWIDGADDEAGTGDAGAGAGAGGAVVAFDALNLASGSTDAVTGKGRMAFEVEVAAEAEQPLRGRWDIAQPGPP
jgi:hypothetical protein